MWKPEKRNAASERKKKKKKKNDRKESVLLAIRRSKEKAGDGRVKGPFCGQTAFLSETVRNDRGENARLAEILLRDPLKARLSPFTEV